MHTKQLTILALTAITFFGLLSTSCKKSNTSNPPDPYKSDTLYATINGSLFATGGDNAYGYHDTTLHLWSVLGLRKPDSSIVSLSIADTFTINQPVTTLLSALQYAPSPKAGYYNFVETCNTTITVTSLDTVKHLIAGTFSGNLTGHGILYFGQALTDTAVVTNGKFSVYYTLSVQPPHP